MPKSKRPRVLSQEQAILDEAELVLLSDPADLARAKRLVAEHHYLKDATVVGENLLYLLHRAGEWLAIAIWAAPARHLKDRDLFIGGQVHVAFDHFHAGVESQLKGGERVLRCPGRDAAMRDDDRRRAGEAMWLKRPHQAGGGRCGR